ncbi:MAG: SMP-30/gluconolactonase/LRE family protein [Planctomycetota bacterium]
MISSSRHHDDLRRSPMRFAGSPMRFCRWIAAALFACVTWGCVPLGGTHGVATAEEPRTLGKVISHSPQVSTQYPIEVIAAGMTWCEGPVWVADSAAIDPGVDGGYLLFSDIPRNTIFRWREGSGVDVFMQPSGYTGVRYYGLEPGSNGLVLDPQGRLCMCEHGDRRLSRLTTGGGKVTLVDRFEGKRLNSPNDLVFAKDGTLYFTDPPYGLPERADDPRRELSFCGVFRLSTRGVLSVVSEQIERPNGIGLSADGKRLVVAQSNPKAPTWTVFEIAADGSASSGKIIRDAKETMSRFPGLPDGLCVSKSDLIYASAPGGIDVMNFDGQLLGRFETGKRTSNCALDADERYLYITADDTVCRVRLK